MKKNKKVGVFYVLNYNKRCINTLSLCITLVICVVLFIILDLCILNVPKQQTKKNVNVSSIKLGKFCNPKRKSLQNGSLDLNESLIELMQIADIYDENTKVEELENDETYNKGVEKVTNIAEKEYEFSYLDMENKWRIKIPKINIDAPIKSGTTQKVLAIAVGHFEKTNLWNGNVVLAGHNRGYNCNFFQRIKELDIGDRIIYCTDKGKREYKVIMNKIIKQTDWSYVQNTEDNRITLITCVENMHEYRRCIQAVEDI